MPKADPVPLRRFPEFLLAILAVALLAMTLMWQIPMMLWDHLNLVPMLAAWRDGHLAHSAFFRFDGAHLHTAAYAVLLVSAQLSAGHPWLADLLSWFLLVACATIILCFIHETIPRDTHGRAAMASVMVFLALYPGHLANLQWGWQVAVFLCLLGVIVAIFALTRPNLSWWHDFIALLGAFLAYFSFATSLAIFPVALLLIALRHDQTRRRRMFLAAPWLLACLGIAFVYQQFASAKMAHDVPTESLYFLNFLGAGISRLATDLAPWLALLGIALACWAGWRRRHERMSLPWIGLAAFGFCAGLLVSLGRTSALGADQAFVSRYVSFSILFWLGLFGLLARIHVANPSRSLRVALVVIAVFAFGNALQMMHRARKIGNHTHTVARTIRDTWPHVNNGLLGKIYFGKPQIARQRLALLHAWGYAPFGGAASASRESDPAVEQPTRSVVNDKPSVARPGS